MGRPSNANQSSLKKENENLKKELEEFKKEFDDFKSKMATSVASTTSPLDPPNSTDVQFLSNGFDYFSKFQEKARTQLKSMESKLIIIETNIQRLSDAIDESLIYSYQYNLKIVGVPQENKKETAEETTKLCLKIFKEIGANVSVNDIDIAHRVPLRSNEEANNTIPRAKINPIICKFTRRLAKDDVFQKKKTLPT